MITIVACRMSLHSQDEIIEMAMKSGCPKVNAFANFDILQEFAKLVAEEAAKREREACADLCYQLVDNSRETRFATAIRARGEA